MYITKKEVLDLRNEVQTELDDFTYGRANKHIMTVQGEDRIILLYVVDLLKRLEQMLKRGNYEKSRIFGALKEQDWMWYSCHRSLHSDRLLRERLGIKPNKNILITRMLAMQARYLENASNYIIQRLED